MTVEAQRLPNFIVVGAMKAGSTAAYAYLRAHPQVFIPPALEVHYFTSQYSRGLDWYASHFRDAGDALAVGEKSPSYMVDPVAVERMAATIPDAKLVAVLRNPIDRAYSHYWHNKARDREPRPYEEAIADEWPQAGDGGFFDYLSRGRYAAQLERLCEHYDRSQLHVVLSEELRHRSVETYAELCRFLGVDDTIVPDVVGRAVNEHVGKGSRRVSNAVWRLPLPKKWRVSAGRAVRRTSSYPPMDPETRRRLEAHFEEDNAALARWLGRDLDVWAPAPAL